MLAGRLQPPEISTGIPVALATVEPVPPPAAPTAPAIPLHHACFVAHATRIAQHRFRRLKPPG